MSAKTAKTAKTAESARSAGSAESNQPTGPPPPARIRRRGRRHGRTLVLALAATALAACSTTGAGEDGAGSPGGGNEQVVVVTHESWAVPKKVLHRFTEKTGYTVKVEPSGDAGALTNKLVLTKGSPLGDVVYGIDNTFASRAVDAEVLARYTPENMPGSARKYALEDDTGADELTPVDYGDVCVNVDDTWFARHDVPEPTSLADLTKPAYKGLFVTPGATTSSPGLAFLLTTIAKYGDDGWQDYWKQLMANDTEVTAGWSDAYEVSFTAGGGNGDRPIVLSYASSPPFTIPEGKQQPTTSALLDTCYRQVEYAGVLAGAENPEGAKAFVDFMQGRAFQRALPNNMYVYPVNDAVSLPEDWAKYAHTAQDPFQVDPARVTENRDAWLRQWGDIITR